MVILGVSQYTLGFFSPSPVFRLVTINTRAHVWRRINFYVGTYTTYIPTYIDVYKHTYVETK